MSHDYAEAIKDQWAHIEILPLDELAKLPTAEQYDSGVYFLWRGDELLYIGRSKIILDRIQRLTQARRGSALYASTHKAVPFDRYTALVLSKGMEVEPGLENSLRLHERAYINAYKPAYNFDTASGLT